MGRGGVIPFGAFGWAFARAHCDLRGGFAFHWPKLKAGIDCGRREQGRADALKKRMTQLMGGQDACQ